MGNKNFLKELLTSIFSSSDPEVAKKKALKNIAKNLSKTKYNFYKLSSHEVDARFAKFLYDIYKDVSPAQIMIQSMNVNSFKRMILDHSVSEKQGKALENLSEVAITEEAKGKPLKEVAKYIKTNLEDFANEFDSTKTSRIDLLYTDLVCFANFVQFDFYFMLKKFDSAIKEHSFSKEPHFSNINGTYIVEDLKNFADVAWPLSVDSSWDDVFKLIKNVKGTSPVQLSAWKKTLSKIRYLRDNRIIEMMIQLISENPSYREEVSVKDLHIVDDFISDVKKQADETYGILQKKQTDGKIETLLNQVFGTSSVEPLKFYNEAGSSPFERKNLGKYEHCLPLSYLKKFILDYVKKDVKELSDILLVRGEWANQQLASPMSDAFNTLVEISGKIIALDNSLDSSVDLGLKMKTHLPQTERNKESRNIISSTLNHVNDEAGKLIIESAQNLISYDKNLKMVLEDCVKQRPVLIMNWKAIDHFTEGNLKQMCVDAYKMIFNFVSLLQNFPIKLHEDN